MQAEKLQYFQNKKNDPDRLEMKSIAPSAEAHAPQRNWVMLASVKKGCVFLKWLKKKPAPKKADKKKGGIGPVVPRYGRRNE